MSRGPDAATLLERALLAEAAGRGCPVAIADSTMARWASATFTGARHAITLRAPASDALDAWLPTLADTEFALRGHLVADLGLTRVHRHDGVTDVMLEALTVETR